MAWQQLMDAYRELACVQLLFVMTLQFKVSIFVLAETKSCIARATTRAWRF